MLRHLRLVLSSIGMLALTLAIAAFGGESLGSQPEEVQITVMEVINRVETYRPRTERPEVVGFFQAQVGQDLLPGDVVKTFPNSEARIDIAIREFTRITRTAPNTIWRLGQFAVDGPTIIELDQGKLFLFDEGFREGQPEIEVVTPAGTASPRGTWMSVEYQPQTGVARVQCFRGECELSNSQGTVALVDERKSAMTIQTAPLQPEVMDQEEIASFTQLPEARKGEVAIPPVESARPAAEPALEMVYPATGLEQPASAADPSGSADTRSLQPLYSPPLARGDSRGVNTPLPKGDTKGVTVPAAGASSPVKDAAVFGPGSQSERTKGKSDRETGHGNAAARSVESAAGQNPKADKEQPGARGRTAPPEGVGPRGQSHAHASPKAEGQAGAAGVAGASGQTVAQEPPQGRKDGHKPGQGKDSEQPSGPSAEKGQGPEAGQEQSLEEEYHPGDSEGGGGGGDDDGEESGGGDDDGEEGDGGDDDREEGDGGDDDGEGGKGRGKGGGNGGGGGKDS